MINLQQQLRMGLKLTPQQVQYLKLLQLPTIAMEQRIKTELEINPMLELDETVELQQEEPEVDIAGEDGAERNGEEDSYTLEDYMNDDLEGYKSPERYKNTTDDNESYESPIASVMPLSERILSQFRMLTVDETDILLAEEIIGNIDEDGYLRRDLALIVQDLNLSFGLALTLEQAECVLRKIQQLDPPGIGARNLQECIVAQLHAAKIDPMLKELALKVVQNHFEDLKQRRFEQLAHHLHASIDTLKKVIDHIQRLNPRPGEGQFTAQENYVTPDFIVRKDEDDFIIILNDRNIPALRLNRAYKDLASSRSKTTTREAKDFIKQKFEAAKWFISSIHQRRETLLKVMRAIVDRQRQWFEEGEILKPMIYKDIAETVGVDISTISRVVNNKYVQTEYGVFHLKYFFTSGLESESGESISNLMVKQRVKQIIDEEHPQRPYNDDKIAEILQKEGIKIARRTVAKYREMLGLPVARMRKKM
jgi:RNA polymerase sigma-54 factor